MLLLFSAAAVVRGMLVCWCSVLAGGACMLLCCCCGGYDEAAHITCRRWWQHMAADVPNEWLLRHGAVHQLQAMASHTHALLAPLPPRAGVCRHPP